MASADDGKYGTETRGTRAQRFLNRPWAREYDLPFSAPPTPHNPVLRGIALPILANLLVRVTFVQDLLWANAGFGQLRDRPELQAVTPRYDPTVIARTSSGDTNYPSTSQEACLRALSDDEHVWTAKRPPASPSAFPSILDYHAAYRSGTTTPLVVIENLLPHIRRDVKPKRSEHATAFLSTKLDLVRRAAEASTARWQAGKPLSLLDGVPMAVKDEADLAGYSRSLGSALDFTSKDANATSFCVAEWQAAGAICIGKTSMHELGVDTNNCNVPFGTPRNPYSREYFCGGSSGGSGYAVATGLVPFALGFDGGGSVRIPAAYCGIFGLKTSAGRVSARPSVGLAKSNGVPGPMAANMVDLELAYRAMARPDPGDEDSRVFSPPSTIASPSTGKTNPKGRKLIGVCRPWLDRADSAVRALIDAAITDLTTNRGWQTVDISLPLLAEGQTAHAMTILTEIGAGISDEQLRSLSPATQILLATGRRTSARDLLQAQKVRHLLMRHLAHLFDLHSGGEEVRGEGDEGREGAIFVVLSPTTPNAGWRSRPADFRYGVSDANLQLRNMEYVWLANFTGCPAISAPVGYVDVDVEDGGKKKKEKADEQSQQQQRVPVGIMGMVEWGAEDDLLAFGYDVERFLAQRGRPRPAAWVDVLDRVAKK